MIMNDDEEFMPIRSEVLLFVFTSSQSVCHSLSTLVTGITD